MNGGGDKNTASIWFALAACAALAAIMLVQALQLADMSWLNPNPDVPRPVFGLIGLVLLAALPLLLNQIFPLHQKLINLAGYSFFAIALLLVHWLVFLSEGGSCSLNLPGLWLGVPLDLCSYVIGGVVVLFDLFLGLLLVQALFKVMKS